MTSYSAECPNPVGGRPGGREYFRPNARNSGQYVGSSPDNLGPAPERSVRSMTGPFGGWPNPGYPPPGCYRPEFSQQHEAYAPPYGYPNDERLRLQAAGMPGIYSPGRASGYHSSSPTGSDAFMQPPYTTGPRRDSVPSSASSYMTGYDSRSPAGPPTTLPGPQSPGTMMQRSPSEQQGPGGPMSSPTGPIPSPTMSQPIVGQPSNTAYWTTITEVPRSDRRGMPIPPPTQAAFDRAARSAARNASRAPVFIVEGQDMQYNSQGRPLSHICKVCSRAFDRPSALQIHERSHTGERPFPCPWTGCAKSFTTNGNMVKHSKICPFRLMEE